MKSIDRNKLKKPLIIKNGKCCFCNKILTRSTVWCSYGEAIECLECKECNKFFLEKNNFLRLFNLANSEGRLLKSNIYLCKNVLIRFTKVTLKEDDVKDVKVKKKVKQISKKNERSKTTKKPKRAKPSIGNFEVESQRIVVRHDIDRKCAYYDRGICIYFNDYCNLHSFKCINKESNKTQNATTKNIRPKENRFEYEQRKQRIVKVTAIVLSYNRKCTIENHPMEDVYALVKIANQTGEVFDYNIPAVYCGTCNLFFVLYEDFKKAKECGVILCQIVDSREQLISGKQNKYQSGGESKIHSLGYNVRKDKNYTRIQRRIVLANALENHDVSKFEVKSNLSMNIGRHKGQANYASCVQKWKEDLEFIESYNTGDIPQVLIDKIQIGRNEK